MEPVNQKTTRKIRRLVATIIGMIILLILALWLVFWLWIRANTELAAECDDGFTIWRRNPGAFSSYIYEIREDGIAIQSGLRYRNLESFLSEHGCLFLDGG